LLAGHSFGANAALAYMAEIGDADGIIAIAPGHSPRYRYDSGMVRSAVNEARAAAAGGRADEKIKLNDMNQGQRRDFNLPAQILLSYFEPDGWGHMPATAARFKRAVPFMWVIGTRDPLVDDTLFMASRWQAARNRTDLAVWPGGAHVFISFQTALAEKALARIDAFLADAMAA
jgi:acetyl esterase/lipase